MQFDIDDWVIYRQFPDNPNSVLYDMTEKAVVLDILEDDNFYDYKICIDDGTRKIKKVREVNLEKITDSSGKQK